MKPLADSFGVGRSVYPLPKSSKAVVSVLSSLLIALLLAACTTATKNSTLDVAAAKLETKPSSTQSEPGYVIGIEDVLNISVWKEVDLNRDVVVRPDGKISFPLVGDIYVQGLAVDDVKNLLKGKLKKYIPDALVNVSLVKSASYKIYVLGKVNQPGQYVLGSYIDVLQALSLANGLTPFAAQDDIKILTKKEGRRIALPFAYSRASKGQNMEQNITLKSGDIVLVP